MFFIVHTVVDRESGVDENMGKRHILWLSRLMIPLLTVKFILWRQINWTLTKALCNNKNLTRIKFTNNFAIIMTCMLIYSAPVSWLLKFSILLTRAPFLFFVEVLVDSGLTAVQNFLLMTKDFLFFVSYLWLLGMSLSCICGRRRRCTVVALVEWFL